MPVTRDATSNICIPQSASEWVTLAVAGVAAPDFLWLCQEASGNLADSIGAITLTASGTGLAYQQAVTGWTTKALTATDASNGSWLSTSASLPDSSTTSTATLYYIRWPAAAPAGSRAFAVVGNATNTQPLVSSNAGTPISIKSGGNTATSGIGTVASTVYPVMIVIDRTLGTTSCYFGLDVITPAQAAVTGKRTILTSAFSNAAVGYLYACEWAGANAEMSAPTVKGLFTALGFTVTGFVVTYSAPVSDALAVGDRLDSMAASVVALAESDATVESVAAASVAAVALAESETTAATIVAAVTAIAGVAEAEAVAESLAAIYLASPSGLAEALATVESLGITFTFGALLSDALLVTESALIAVIVQFLADFARFANTVVPNPGESACDVVADISTADPGTFLYVTPTVDDRNAYPFNETTDFTVRLSE